MPYDRSPYHRKLAKMSDEIEEHIAAVEMFYAPLINGVNSRLKRGEALWRQFTDTVASYRNQGGIAFAPVYERINELAVARALLDDPSLTGCDIIYEPPLVEDGRRIDFSVPGINGKTLYIEVKTVRPVAKDNEENWAKHMSRQDKYSSGTELSVEKYWMGASISVNSFSARAKFMEYVREFEPRLVAANAVKPGRGLLVFCGTGMEWHCSELEDFADFYRTGKHRVDDPYAAMEAYALTKNLTQMMRNVTAFCFLKRKMTSMVADEFIVDVHGPRIFQ